MGSSRVVDGWLGDWLLVGILCSYLLRKRVVVRSLPDSSDHRRVAVGAQT